MESRAKFAGHAIHPMLIVFPLGLLGMAVVFDILFKVTGTSGLAMAAFWNISAGIITGLLAGVFGFWDWLHIPGGTRAKAIGLWHGVGNLVVTGLFALSWLLRYNSPDYVPDNLAFGLGVAALALAAVTAWLGGELVERLGVGVDPGANLNAPSSLSDKPARADLSDFRSGA